MSLQYQNVMFANVDVDYSQVRIFNLSMWIHKIKYNVIENTVSVIINLK